MGFKKAFTLVELVITVTIFSLILTVAISIYFQMQKLQTDVFAKSLLIKNTNSLVEKLNIVMKNYTIDYEEYFNRKIVGCNSNWWDNFSWNVGLSGYCWNFTHYGNANPINNSKNHILYHCSSKWSSQQLESPWWTTDCESNSNTWTDYIYHQNETDLHNWSGCWESVWAWKPQSFGEYALQFWDVKGNADWYMGCRWDDDDIDLWVWPEAIWDNLNVKELYLISKDNKKRLFIRRKLISQENFDNDSNYTTWERLYKLQILKLRWFDIWGDHKISTIDNTSNDWKIDTWACDKQEGFVCWGDNIWITDYNLSKDENDWWVDLTINDLTVLDFNLAIFPTKDPNLAWYDSKIQIYPYVRVRLTTQFYPTNYKKKLNPKRLLKYKMNLQTTFSIKPY